MEPVGPLDAVEPVAPIDALEPVGPLGAVGVEVSSVEPVAAATAVVRE